MDTYFKDAIMDSLRAKARSASGSTFWTVAPSIVRSIYDGTPSTSKARAFLVDVFHAHAEAGILDSKDGYPTEFLLDLARTSLERRNKTPMISPTEKMLAKCNYHQHDSEGRCYRDGKP